MASEHFTYTVHSDIGGDVLVLAAEDVTGISPAAGRDQRASTPTSYAAALDRGRLHQPTSTTSTRTGRKAPHPLGVLSHYKAVVWETGDDIIPRATGPGRPARRPRPALDTELAVRDYLNEGGKLLLSGKYAGFAQARQRRVLLPTRSRPAGVHRRRRDPPACRC